MEFADDREPLVDPEVKAFVFSLVSALGGSSAAEDGRYVLGDDALAVLKDIKRWLRLYDNKTNRLDVARLLAEANLVKGDLLEILASWPEHATEGSLRAKIALYSVDLLTQLTWPVEKDERDAAMHHFLHIPYLQSSQASYKRAMLHHPTSPILRTIVRVALPPMAQPREERSPVEENIIKVVLYLFRNIAMIKMPDNPSADEDDIEISRSATVDAFHKQDVFNLLLTIGSGISDEFQMHDVELTEILFYLLKGVDAEKLFMDNDEILSSDTRELQTLLGKEKGMKAEQSRHAPSRHNRFGTMVWVERDDKRRKTIFGQHGTANEQAAMHEMDRSKKWKRPRRGGRKAAAQPDNDMDVTIPLTNTARRHLRVFSEQFLDSSFNPLFLSVRRTIEREAPRVMDYHRRQYFFLVAWFLKAETARRRKAVIERVEGTDQPALESFGLVATVLNQETFVLLNRSMELAQDNKSWQDLNACMKCFTRILLTVQDMSDSPLEDDQEIAENILSRIFYEQTTHDRIIALLRTYAQQGFGYLDACTELSHVFLRLIERYSKQNMDMQVRSIRRARKKKAAAQSTNEDDPLGGDRVLEAEDVAEAQKTSSERRFDFNKLAAKFINQSTIDTFVALTRYFRDLSDDQLKRAHRFFHRAAFKMDLSVYLFRADIILLFQRMIKGPEGMDITSAVFKDWEELVRQVFRRLIEKMEERPALGVELLFSKIPSTMFYLEHGYEREPPKKAHRPPPAELEVKPGMDHAEQIGVAVSVLINASKSDMLAWVKEVLSNAAEERKGWEEEAAARTALDQPVVPSVEQPESIFGQDNPPTVSTQDPSSASPNLELSLSSPPPNTEPSSPPITMQTTTPEHRLATHRDKHLRLLLTLLSFTPSTSLPTESAPPSTTWTIPSILTSTRLTADLTLIKAFEFAPPTYAANRPAESFLRRKPLPHAPADPNTSDENTSDIDIDVLQPPNLSTTTTANPNPKRRRTVHTPTQLDDATLTARRAARQAHDLERARRIKSSLYVSISDDESDAERDAAFFEREARLREDMARGVRDALVRGAGKRGVGREGAGVARKRRRVDVDERERERETEDLGVEKEQEVSTSDLDSAEEPGTASEADTETATPPSSLRPSSRRSGQGTGATVSETTRAKGLGITYGEDASRHVDEDAEMDVEVEMQSEDSDKENAGAGTGPVFMRTRRRRWVVGDDEDSEDE